MTQTDAAAKPDREPQRRTGPVTFVKQVVGELRKVRWPTRRELITYTIVVMVFVVIMVGYISLLDFGFGEAVTWLYGTVGSSGEATQPGGEMPGVPQ
ncbi:preprotein translocase subunit SecE [Lipingzhangella halophila]|uniref:Protein translocase subunit SecE n=1 Tax=Lipingzhangella halophila TaxID=1783352 RepID=A0A7W7RCA5_9ACTN|nr:preprotein translocase subunit SecE [Lipingzhangella halophila]MBB4929343.1 preprotein translocase subunit SecE [Lipingzhangella halophila]